MPSWAQVVAKAIAEIEGDFSDTQVFLDALPATDIDSVSGPFGFDERGQSVRNLYIIQAIKDADGNYTHEVEDVTPNWIP